MSAEPFIKWVGGKRGLLPQIMRRVVVRPKTYFEPFLGGGAVLFHMIEEVGITRAVVGDTNPDLIETYKAVRENVDLVIEYLKVMKFMHSETFYYMTRDSQPDTSESIAARFIYINKAGFNGLWRVNKAGKCNVPYGHNPKANICDETRLRLCSRALAMIDFDIECRDFSAMVYADARPGDFVYLDPPYVPVTATANFTGYAKAGFGPTEQKRLASLMLHFKAAGVRALLSNSDCESTWLLYEGLNIERVSARRAINSDATKRGHVGELLVSTMPPGDTT